MVIIIFFFFSYRDMLDGLLFTGSELVGLGGLAKAGSAMTAGDNWFFKMSCVLSRVDPDRKVGHFLVVFTTQPCTHACASQTSEDFLCVHVSGSVVGKRLT